MSVIRLKKIPQLGDDRLKRSDLSPLVASLIVHVDRLGMQQAKRKRDDEPAGSGTPSPPTSQPSSQNVTPVRPVRGAEAGPSSVVHMGTANPSESEAIAALEQLNRDDIEKRTELEEQIKGIIERVKPYETSGTITSSTITSMIYKGLSGKEFCWKLDDYYSRKKPFFPNITRMFFMPGGNILEDTVLDFVDAYLGTPVQRQYQEGGNPELYEKDAINRMDMTGFEFIVRQNGFTNQESEDLTLWGRKVRCRADGVTPTHVVEVKVPFGSLYKVWGSGTVQFTDESGIKQKRYDERLEEFVVPPHYMCQLLIEMNCFNRRKALFGQYYSFSNWYSLLSMLVKQYKQVQRGASFRRGTVLYKPILSLLTPVNTIMKRIIKLITEPADLPKLKLQNRKRATKRWYQFLVDYCGVLPVPGDVMEGKQDEIETWVQRNWDIKRIQELTTNANLIDFSVMELNPQSVFRFSPFQRQEILKALKVGMGKDIQRGVVQPNVKTVLWDGDVVAKPMPSPEEYLNGMKQIIKTVIGRCSRKNKEVWDPFERLITNRENPIIDPGLFPTYDSAPYDEYVLLEVDLSNERVWEEAMARLKQFLKLCEAITQKQLACKGGKRGEPKMMGENKIRDQFIAYLKSIPVKMLKREKVAI